MEKAKRVDTINNLPPSRVRQCGAWTEQFSSNGRRYFYNRETEISQWDKPTAWLKAEEIIDPDQIRDPDVENDDRFSYSSDRCGSSPEKIDVSDDENSMMEEEMDEEEQRRKTLEATQSVEEENEEKAREKELNKYYGYRRFLNEEVLDLKYKQMFGSERIVRPYTKENYPYHLSRRVEDLNFQIDYDEKIFEASKARRLAESSLYTADFYQRKTEGLRELSKELEERHQNFQNNFETTMTTLVAQSKNESAFASELSAWIEWPDEKIVEHHETILARRSEGFQAKRARFMEKYKPKPPTPSPSPEPSLSAVVILDEKKLRELEVRTPSPSYEEPMEMVVSPVYEDEYDPTARAVPSHDYSESPHSSSPSRSAGTDSFRTQEYTQPTNERPLEFILEPPPAFPILPPISPNPVISPIVSPVHSPRSPPIGSPVHSPPLSPALRSPYHPRSPDLSVRSPIIASDHPSFPHPFHPNPVKQHMIDPTMMPVFDPTRPPPTLPPQFLPPPPPAPVLDKLFEECEMKKDPFYRSVK